MIPLLLLVLALVSAIGSPAAGQAYDGPDTVRVTSGPLTLRALLWHPPGNGPFPAVLFNHGSYSTGDTLNSSEPAALGPLFARHGFVFLFLFRRGVGPSANQGAMEGDIMARSLAADGQEGRNRVQLHLLDGEALNEAVAALDFLRALPRVDVRRIAVAGHSFGGSLTLFLAARDTALRAAVIFGGAAGSWAQSPRLRERLLTAVGHTSASVLFIHAANDYSVAPGEALAGEMERLKKPHELHIYPAFGRTAREGHNLVYRSVDTWERDVFAFLKERLQD